MLKRYLITLGAPTTAGGKVTSAHHFRKINGAPVAVEGDKVWCGQCNSEGIVVPDGPRLTERVNGKQVALQDDLCMCHCNPPPRLVANQNSVCQLIDLDWHAAQTAKAAEAIANSAATGSSPAGHSAVPIVLLHPATKEPFKHRPYRLQLADKVITGTTDHNGATQPLTAAERASLLTWHVDDAPGNA